MSLYPIYVDLKGKTCVVAGGGKVAERKISTLLKCGCKIVVIAPSITDKISKLADKNKIIWYERTLLQKDIKNCFLVIGATSDKKVNKEIYKFAEKNNKLVNVVDDPKLCNFIVPATLKKGPLYISVSTSGKSPVLAALIRDDLKNIYTKEYGKFLGLLGKFREEFKKNYKSEERKKIIKNILDEGAINLIKNRKIKEAEELIKKWVKGKYI